MTVNTLATSEASMKCLSTVEPKPVAPSTPDPLPGVGIGCLMPMRAEVVETRADGRLPVKVAEGKLVVCDWLESHLTLGSAVSAGDAVLIMADQIHTSWGQVSHLSLLNPAQCPSPQPHPYRKHET